MTDLYTRYPTVIDTLIVHFDISLDVFIVDLAFMFGHQAAIAKSTLVAGFFNLSIQLLFVLLHALPLSIASRQLLLLFCYHTVSYLFSKLLILQLLHFLVHVSFVDLEVEAFTVRGFSPELIP
jgi:hypothetical protein